jgi:hypothetical protein
VHSFSTSRLFFAPPLFVLSIQVENHQMMMFVCCIISSPFSHSSTCSSSNMHHKHRFLHVVVVWLGATSFSKKWSC